MYDTPTVVFQRDKRAPQQQMMMMMMVFWEIRMRNVHANCKEIYKMESGVENFGAAVSNNNTRFSLWTPRVTMRHEGVKG